MSAANPSDPRLRRLLGGDALAPLRKRLRRYFEHLEPDAAPTTLRLNGLDPAAHHALCQLTGRPIRPARSMTLDLTRLDASLRAAGLADSLRDALQRLDGPIVAKSQRLQHLQARWAAALNAVNAGPLLRAWLNTPASQALLKRLSRDSDHVPALLNAADHVLRALPAQGQPRSQLAANLLGDAHALDAGRPVATLVLAAWRHHEQNRSPHGALTPAAEDAQQKGDAEERQRDIWARAGILINELARPALCLNLPVIDPAQAPGRLGEPAYLSLRQLLRTPPAWSVAHRPVFICENPNLLAIAADRLGARCAPLVCTDGMPSAAQRTLLDQLQRAGARLCYHGDFDWPGIGIANFVIRTWNAAPWRMRAQDYETAARAAPPIRHALGAAPIQAEWDSLLVSRMRDHDSAIAEEAVASVLLEDLCTGADSFDHRIIRGS